LKHPYIVRYRDSFLDNKKLCIVMSYAEKGDLYKRIKAAARGKPISSEQVMTWFTQATLALKYLHELHILHRDLKTQNMFLAADDRLKIGDFGISRLLAGTCAFAKTVIGTPYYMAPEICAERPYSWASDIWALGCVLFEMYQLKVPFEGRSVKELMQKIAREKAPPCSRAPSAARDLCCKMMARDSRQRPTASQILEYPVIQEQIRAMLKEERPSSGEAKPAAPLAEFQPANRAPSPKPGKPPRPNVPRDPSNPVLKEGPFVVQCASPRRGPQFPQANIPPSPRRHGSPHSRAASPSRHHHGHRGPSPRPSPRHGGQGDWYSKAMGLR